MRNIDEIGLKLCKMQAEVFEKSATRFACSSAVFVRRFMLSSVAKRIDDGGYLFESCSENDILSEIEKEYGESSYGSEKIASEELYWIGYIYRYWCYTRQKTSKQVYRIIKMKDLRALYYPYHSLDPAQAIDRILESKAESPTEQDMIQKGVEILRRKKTEQN